MEFMHHAKTMINGIRFADKLSRLKFNCAYALSGQKFLESGTFPSMTQVDLFLHRLAKRVST